MTEARTTRIIQYQLPAMAWAVFIFTVSSIPQTRLPSFIAYSDKLVHAGVFFILCWLLDVALRFQGIKPVSRYSLWLALILTSLFGASDEYHQLFTPGRSTDFFDWCADTAGAGVYVFLYLKFRFYDWHTRERDAS